MEHNFYTIMLMFLGAVAVVFIIMVLSMTLINYAGAMYYHKSEQKKREKLGVEYFFQDEDGNEVVPIKNEDFQPVKEDLFDEVIKDKKRRLEREREDISSGYIIVNEEISRKDPDHILPDEEFKEFTNDLYEKINKSKK